ncbi:MAG TPA: hypothetical protein VD905_21375 [Flavobacteriales bacterium]|nr:hypothetical protein [Flavobacteriales bacterium]
MNKTKTQAFTSKNILEKLVNHYGLPAFLFTVTGNLNFTINGDKADKKVELVPYPSYKAIEQYAKNVLLVFEDLWRLRTDMVASRISRYAGYHDKIDARSCAVVKINKEASRDFLNKNHLMGYANAAYHYALIHEKQLVAAAVFSKGRNMDRLPEGKKSFEMVRFATIPFLTVTGGLSKMLHKFAGEYKPGDVMTYIDALSGETAALKRLGFEEMGFTNPVELFVNTKTHERFFKANEGTDLRFMTVGNYKLVKTF